MLQKCLAIYCLLFGFAYLNAQEGPGGVGSASNNGLWLSADRIAQSSGTTVNAWPDLSGNANDGFQTESAFEPTFISNVMNGYPVVRFDGTGDQIEIADADILDNSTGLTFYTVIQPSNLSGAPRGILGKRVTYSTTSDYAYTWFFHSSNRLNLDLNTSNNRFNTGSTTYSNGTNYILSMHFDGTLPAANRSEIATNGSLTVASTESSTAIINSSENLVLGALNVDYGQYLGADYAEVIQFNKALNETERIIIENYLSAKYNITLSSNDIFEGDDSSEGNFDHDVAGIGQVNSSDNHRDSRGSGIIRISNPTDLNDDEFLFWGHDNGTLQATELGDVPSGVQGRFERTWKFSELSSSKSTVDVGNVDIQFDLADLGPVTASDLRLLIDINENGLFDDAPISGASHDGGTLYSFSGVSAISDGLTFTLGSTNLLQTPLPVELSSFDVFPFGKDQVKITWQTLSEINNSHFLVERSKSGKNWETVTEISGAGSSNSTINYEIIDHNPFPAFSYYRLKQVDFDGSTTIFEIKSVKLNQENQSVLIYPNPTMQKFWIEGEASEISKIQVFNAHGNRVDNRIRVHYNSVNRLMVDLADLAPGLYIIWTATQHFKLYKS